MPSPADGKSSPRIELRDFRLLPENRSAVRAIQSLAGAAILGRRPAVTLVVLHGPPGCGKTQLVNAFVGAITTGTADVTARIESAGDLARLETTGEDAGFADRDLMTCDVLVIEDVQHLPEPAADAVSELVDQRARRRKPLVVTAGRGPAGLSHLPHRLTSRLAAGLSVTMEPPGLASRRLILADAALTRGVRLAPDALDFLAGQAGGVRAALGALQNLALVAKQLPGRLDRPAVEEILTGTGQPTSDATGLGAIIKRVAVAFAVTERELLGPSRLRNVLRSRQVAMYLARELTGLSLPRIGAAFDRDHTTVLHACRKVEAEVASDAALASRVRQLRSELG